MNDEQLASMFLATPTLLPHLPELLRDLHDMGAMPGMAVDMLREADLARGSRVLDLGCGKGAVGLALARVLGARVLGLDCFAPFLREAEARAQAVGLGAHCVYEQADVRELRPAEDGQGWDLAVCLAATHAFPSLAECVRAMRRVVRPGGLLLLDRRHARGEQLDFPGHGRLDSREDVLAALTAHGDAILIERPVLDEPFHQRHIFYLARMEARAQALGQRMPELTDELDAWMAKWRSECAHLEEHTQGSMWLLRREA